MATASSPPSSVVPSKSTFACIRCAERKVRCDRQRPCSACVNHKVDCVFQPPRPPQRRQRHAKEQILTDRLRYYETLLQEHGVDMRKIPDGYGTDSRRRSSHRVSLSPKEPHRQTLASKESEPSGSVSNTQVIQGQERSMLVENSLWTRVVEEFHDSEDTLENCFDHSSDSESSESDFSLVLNSRPKSTLKFHHPPPDRIHRLWQTFKENVDPLTKVIHVPTVQPAIHKAASNSTTIPRTFEALMFAIYSTAVMSLTDDECKHRFYEPRNTLLRRYISATKAALSRARFMETTNLVTLQALTLHLLSVRDLYKPRAVWTMTGIAIRIAQGMGLERDGELLGSSPFETEIRRRVWWLLKSHDHRSAELCGLFKFRDLGLEPDSTKCPTNVNDDQLYPGMSSLLIEPKTMTDMAFVALKNELTSFTASRVTKFRQKGKSSSQWDRDLASGGSEGDDPFAELEGLLEMKYLRYCDPSQALHLMTMMMARAAMNTIRFLTHHPRRWASIEQTPLSERQRIWEVSIKLLEQHNMLQSSPQLKRFAWYAAFVMQWHALIHVLDTLRANPLTSDAERAWELIGSTYENNTAMIMDTKKPIHVAVGSLCLKAYNARATALQQRDSRYLTPFPEFIMKLRQQQELAKAKRQARDAKNNRAENAAIHGQAETHNRNTRPAPSVIPLSDMVAPAHSQQSTTAHPPNSAQTSGGATNDDPFWFINGIDDRQSGSLDDVVGMELDPDFMLAQGHSVGDNTETINWEQWDTWLAQSNSMPPFLLGPDPGAVT